MSIQDIAAVFGWMTIVNVVIYTWVALFVIFGRDWMARMQARILGIPEEKMPDYFIDYLSRYKLAILIFNLAPYLALRIVA